jgi:non-specific serine/threonine protein kinase
VRAEERLAESLTLFRAAGDGAGVATVLLWQGLAAYYQGQAMRADALLSESLPLLWELEDTVAVARALFGLGLVARQQRELERSRRLFGEALELAWEKGARLEVTQCLEGLAGLTAELGRRHRAARWFGAAYTLRQAIGMELPPGIRSDRDRDVAAVRLKLGTAAFGEVWASGVSLPIDEAVAEALAEARAMRPAAGRRPLTALQAAKQQAGGLTGRERQVAALIAQGWSNAAIAAELVTTVRTVEAHITHILDKLGFTSRTQVAGWAIDKGLARPARSWEEDRDKNSTAGRTE